MAVDNSISSKISSAHLSEAAEATSVGRVIFLLLPNVNLLDLAGPAQVFDAAKSMGKPYQLVFCATQAEVHSAQGLELAKLIPLPTLNPGDLIIVPGLNLDDYSPQTSPPLDSAIRGWLQQASQMEVPIASVCTGAFVLGEAGLLDGRRCTTHWAAIAQLQARYPKARVLEATLFVADRKVTTSAGVAAGIDMALALLEQAHGPIFTAQIARSLVVYLRRNGNQNQGSIYLDYRTHLNPSVHHVQDYLVNNLDKPIALPELAEIAHISIRSLSRTFKEATGLTPIQYQQRLRLELAANLLNNPEFSIEEVAERCGFDDARHFRRLWRREFGTSPSLARRVTKPDQTKIKSKSKKRDSS
jgi:transcriptional regulator GlxA family with amidase domain